MPGPEIDELMTSALDGESIFLPTREDHGPSFDALKWRERDVSDGGS